jgi:hypothetical protein
MHKEVYWVPKNWEGSVAKQGNSLVILIPSAVIKSTSDKELIVKGIEKGTNYKAVVDFETTVKVEDDDETYGLLTKKLYKDLDLEAKGIDVFSFFAYMTSRGAAQLAGLEFEEYLKFEEKHKGKLKEIDQADYLNSIRKIHKIVQANLTTSK